MHTRHHHHPTSHSHLRPLHNSARDRRVQFRRARNKDAPLSDTVDNPAAPLSSEKYAWYDPEVDHHWRLPIGRPLRTPHPIPSDAAPMAPPSHRCDGSDSTLPYSNGTASEGDVRLARGNSFHPDRSDRRLMSNNARREDSSLRPRDRSGKRIGNRGARWRGLMARKDLVDGTADAYCIDTNDKLHDISPRSSLDIEEATSLFSWDEPPSTSVRGWRSNHSLSYRPQPDRRPRLIKDIGRQRCINDLTNIVVASNEPYVSYDRQIFDPVSKLWTYVEASQPSSSPWELRAVGSPVTCSVSGTDDCVNSSRVAPASASTCPDVSAPPPAVPAASAAAAVSECTKRRNSSPGGLAAITSALEAKRAFMASRDLWLGTTRKSVYGPANLEAVIFASEIDDAEEGILRRASMA